MIFETILPGAWELKQDEPCQLFALHVPTAWRQVANTLNQKYANAQGKKYHALPVRSLDRLVAGGFPKIVHAFRGGGWQQPNKPWLLATERMENLAISALPLLIKDWMREEFSSLEESEVESSLATLKDEDWSWEKEPKAYSLLYPKDKDEESVLYNAIPDYLTQEFLKESPIVCFGATGKPLNFYRVVRFEGAELMSWPPQPVLLTNYKGKERTERAFISFVIRFVLQTVPWRKAPLIYHHLSVRRWIVEPLERVPYRGATAYIGSELRLIDGKQQPLCFIPLSLKRWEGETKWPRAISELLADDSRLPDPTALLANPAYNWDGGATANLTQAAIAYDSRHGDKLISLPGVGSLDLAYIDRAIKERLPVRRVGEAVRVSGSLRYLWTLTKPKKKPNAGKSDEQSTKRKKVKKSDPNQLKTPMLRPKLAAPAVFRATETLLQTILILWETPQCRDALIAEICQLLSLSPKGEAIAYETRSGARGEARIYEGELGSLCIKTQFVEDLTQNFNIKPSTPKRERQKQRSNLLEERVSKIVLSLPPAEESGGAIVEIKHKAFPAEADPKLAVRIGIAQAGYPNQHIHAVTYLTGEKAGEQTKSASERVKRAVSDLLRQFGILPSPLINSKTDGVNTHTWLTCFYVLRRTRRTTVSNLPNTVVMMVRLDPVKAKVEVTTPSLFAKNKKNPWVPYPVALKHLLNEKWDPDSYLEQVSDEMSYEQLTTEKKKEEQLLNKFVSDCLRDCLLTPIDNVQPHVLFMVETQNARQSGILSWLQNPNLPANELPSALNIKEPKEKERLWVVRLRKGNDGEVPVATVKDSPGSRARGLYCWQGVCEDEGRSLYLSIRRPLTTEQYILQSSASRLDDGSKPAGNARLLEIAIVHAPGIKPAKLARFVHLLRSRWPYFSDDVALPLPFPFATKAKEYAVSRKDPVDDSESEDSEELQ